MAVNTQFYAYHQDSRSGIRFFTDRGHSMAGHHVGLPGHCEFLPCLESVPVEWERGADI